MCTHSPWGGREEGAESETAPWRSPLGSGSRDTDDCLLGFGVSLPQIGLSYSSVAEVFRVWEETEAATQSSALLLLCVHRDWIKIAAPRDFIFVPQSQKLAIWEMAVLQVTSWA